MPMHVLTQDIHLFLEEVNILFMTLQYIVQNYKIWYIWFSSDTFIFQSNILHLICIQENDMLHER